MTLKSRILLGTSCYASTILGINQMYLTHSEGRSYVVQDWVDKIASSTLKKGMVHKLT